MNGGRTHFVYLRPQDNLSDLRSWLLSQKNWFALQDLYKELGLIENASDSEIKGVIKDAFWGAREVTRVNRILGNPALRAQYDSLMKTFRETTLKLRHILDEEELTNRDHLSFEGEGAPKWACPSCSRLFALRSDGRLRRHKTGNERCPGSETPIPDRLAIQAAEADAAKRASTDLSGKYLRRQCPICHSQQPVWSLYEEGQEDMPLAFGGRLRRHWALRDGKLKYCPGSDTVFYFGTETEARLRQELSSIRNKLSDLLR